MDKTYDYLGSVQYLNGTSQFASTGEGRVYNNSGTFRYDYFMKDQVGNIRLTYTANGSSVNILQRDEYYPFGNTFGSYLGSGGANTYKFNGMEYQENGLNTIDFNARMYDPQIGRTFQPDPMADMYAFKSPYAFLANNPVMVTDPTGMMDEPAKDANEGEDFGAVAPVNAVSWGSWFMNIGLNYRGGNGFLAAFRGEGWGNRGTRQVHTTIDQMYTVVERYLDEYLDFPVAGFRSYKGTKFLGTYLVLNDLQSSSRVIDSNVGFGSGKKQVNYFNVDRSSILTFKNLGNPDFISVKDLAKGTVIFSNSRAGESTKFDFNSYLKKIGQDNLNISITVAGGDETPTTFQYILWNFSQVIPAPVTNGPPKFN